MRGNGDSIAVLLVRIYKISIYKLGDVGILSNLIGSLTNGRSGRWIMKQWLA